MTSLADKITAELQLLVGLALAGGGRMSNVQTFEFRPAEECRNRNGKKIPPAKVNLHVQCSWRLADGERILFGSDDLHRPVDAAVTNFFDWVKNLPALDAARQSWFDAHRRTPPKVLAAGGDGYGGFRLELERNLVLEAFPCHSDRGDDSEHWRLLGHRGDEFQFVITGYGVEPFDPDSYDT